MYITRLSRKILLLVFDHLNKWSASFGYFIFCLGPIDDGDELEELLNQMGGKRQARGKEQRRREGSRLILIDLNNREIIYLARLVMSERVNVTGLLYGTRGAKRTTTKRVAEAGSLKEEEEEEGGGPMVRTCLSHQQRSIIYIYIYICIKADKKIYRFIVVNSADVGRERNNMGAPRETGNEGEKNKALDGY